MVCVDLIKDCIGNHLITVTFSSKSAAWGGWYKGLRLVSYITVGLKTGGCLCTSRGGCAQGTISVEIEKDNAC